MNQMESGYRLVEEKSPTKKVELIARVCYKSEDKIAEGSDWKMIKNLISRRHMAMLEHASICVEVDHKLYEWLHRFKDIITEQVRNDKPSKRCYMKMSKFFEGSSPRRAAKRYLISGNMRAWAEFFTNLEEMKALPICLCEKVTEAAGGQTGCLFNFCGHGGIDTDYIDEPSENNSYVRVVEDFSELSNNERMLHETLSVIFTCDRGVTHELVRMRECSFAQESTRYCNYSQDKHEGELKVIEPLFFDEGSKAHAEWAMAMQDAERHYMELTKQFGASAQEARSVLPHSTKVDIGMTASLAEWHHIFALRACDMDGKCHPQMTEIMRPFFRDMREKYNFAFGDLYTPDEVQP